MVTGTCDTCQEPLSGPRWTSRTGAGSFRNQSLTLSYKFLRLAEPGVWEVEPREEHLIRTWSGFETAWAPRDRTAKEKRERGRREEDTPRILDRLHPSLPRGYSPGPAGDAKLLRWTPDLGAEGLV